MGSVDVDLLAARLHDWGQMARSMPPAWDGGGVAHPINGPQMEPIGRMLPGKGLYLDRDLKSLGISRQIPHVFERSLTMHLAESLMRMRNGFEVLLADERGAINSYDGIINARGAGLGNDVYFAKNSFTTVANNWSSLWQAGGQPSAGTYSASPGNNPNGTTSTGSLSLGVSDPTGGNSKYLLTFGFTAAQAINMIMLTDLLAQVGSISATSFSSQIVSSSALTRYTNGQGVLMTFDITTQLGATVVGLTGTYTNQAGTSGQKTLVSAATLNAGIVQRIFPTANGPFVALAAGDYGVRSVQAIQLDATTGAGVFALNLYFPLMFVPGIVANIYVERDSTVQIDGLTKLVVGSDNHVGALNIYAQTNTTSTGLVVGSMRTVAG